MNRRSFLAGAAAAVGAPAIVRPEILMPIRGIVMPGTRVLTGTELRHQWHKYLSEWQREYNRVRVLQLSIIDRAVVAFPPEPIPWGKLSATSEEHLRSLITELSVPARPSRA